MTARKPARKRVAKASKKRVPNDFRHIGGGCMVVGKSHYSCDDQWVNSRGDSITCVSTQKAHFSMPIHIGGVADLRGLPGVARVKLTLATKPARTPAGKLGSGARFAALSEEVAADYRRKGYSWAEAEAIGKATAASIGRRKYGAKRMASLAAKGKARTKAQKHG